MFLYPLLFMAFSRCSCLWSVPFLVIDLREFGFLGVFWSWILFRLRAFDFRKLLNLFWFFALTGTLTGDEIVQDFLNCIASTENNYTVHITGCSIETTLIWSQRKGSRCKYHQVKEAKWESQVGIEYFLLVFGAD